ncbi:MAG: glycosyltransferase [candidate division KSB1 bacterium]|nr:glycosyltransferase [candidate division KSB1 bacterium]
MLIALSTLTILLTLGYCFLLWQLSRGLFFLKTGQNEQKFQVSVVVAARNEQATIGACLSSLVNQSYSSDCYEIIVINDRSNDRTAEIVREFMQENSQIKLIEVRELPTGISPKKHALELGIRAARGEIILTTDADCAPHSGWIEGMVRYFEPEVGLVAGFSPIEPRDRNTLFSQLLKLDSLSLAAVAAGSFGLNKPLTCNGRNLGYRKETFNSVAGFKQIQHLVSGDDDLFLHLVTRQTNWSVRYSIDRTTTVITRPPQGWRQFANQRIRHASKGRHYSLQLKALLISIYLLNLCLLAWLPVSCFYSNFLWLPFVCWLAKSLAEFQLIYRFAAILDDRRALTIFPLAMILHIPYVVIFGLWGQLGKFSWKEERFKATTGRSFNCSGSDDKDQ